jgi:hypothetical protein
MFLIVLGWLVILGLTCWAWLATFVMVKLSSGFAGRVTGETYVVLFIALILSALTWYFFPFHVTLEVS